MASSSSKDQVQQNPPDAPSNVAHLATLPIPARRLDEVPWEGGGGRFLVNGRLVDHEGRPLHEDGSLKKD